MSNILNEPDYLWQDQINSIFQLKSKDEADVFFNIINLILGVSLKNTDLVKLYKLLGLDNFSKVINAFNGKNLKLISSEELKDAIILALLFYYKEVKRLTWDEIKQEVPFEVNAIKYGIRIKNLNSTIKQEIFKFFK
jgi:hypothetical protein